MATSRRDKAKAELENVNAQLVLKYRRRSTKASERVTNDEINARVLADELYKETATEYTIAHSEMLRWQALKEAFTSRGFMIRELCLLYSANYFNSTSVKSGGRNRDDARSTRNSARAVESSRL